MGERRYRISFEMTDNELRPHLVHVYSRVSITDIWTWLDDPDKYPFSIIQGLIESRLQLRIDSEKVEILQDEAPKQSEGAGCSCGQTDDGQVLNQLKRTALPNPCPICGKCNVKADFKRATEFLRCLCQADEKEHPEDFCMFCGGELVHCDNSLWDGVWVHSVCIPY